ncbi:uncharacterized [Tachysurus ichikawai]
MLILGLGSLRNGMEHQVHSGLEVELDSKPASLIGADGAGTELIEPEELRQMDAGYSKTKRPTTTTYPQLLHAPFKFEPRCSPGEDL